MFSWEGVLPAPQVRTTEDMRPVLRTPGCKCDAPLYFMYRALAKSEDDRAWLIRNDIRYDVTVVPPGDLCGELVKTKGHYHPKNPAGVGYPEVYEVVEGEAHFLLQSRDHTDAVAIYARSRDIVLIPPAYGHITINPSDQETLVMANVVSTRFESEYREYEAMQGAMYYETKKGVFERNPRYGNLPSLRRITAGPHSAAGLCSGPLYRMVAERKPFDFLNHPEQYEAVLTGLLQG
ncbi:MAG: glucose-6-phosphate isomerase family protein [Methanoregulaceae archaeon]